MLFFSTLLQKQIPILHFLESFTLQLVKRLSGGS